MLAIGQRRCIRLVNQLKIEMQVGNDSKKHHINNERYGRVATGYITEPGWRFLPPVEPPSRGGGGGKSSGFSIYR